MINVTKGKLEYTILEPAMQVYLIDEDNRGIIEPLRLHHVKALTDDLEFVVEFHRIPGTGAVDEKREGL